MTLPCRCDRRCRHYRVNGSKREATLAALPRFALTCRSIDDHRNSGMRAKRAARGVVTALLLAACAPSPPPPVDSPAFVRRPPLPGQPGYLETIGFIADGLRHVS